jgi:hypothetical protein
MSLRFGWYGLRVNLRRRLGGYLAVVLLVGLIGGTAMASIAGARRTQSSYPEFLRSTNPSALVVSSFGANTSPSSSNAANTVTEQSMARLPDVASVRSVIAFTSLPLDASGKPDPTNVPMLAAAGSFDGLAFTQDRVAVRHGRLPNLARSDEFVSTVDGAHLLGMQIGQVKSFGVYTSAQAVLPGFGTARVAPYYTITARLVGTVVLNNQLIQDDIDRYPAFLFFTPATTRHLLAAANATLFGLQLRHGDADVPAVEQAFVHSVPAGSTYEFHETASIEARVEGALRPESIALGVFGLIAGVAALVIGILALSRQLQRDDNSAAVLRALGAGPWLGVADQMIGLVAAIVLGAIAAGVVAVALSPLAPVGPVRPVYPHPGASFDATVIGLGVLVVVVVLGGSLAFLGWRSTRRGAVDPNRGASARPSGIARAATAAGLPASVCVGIRFALETGTGRVAVPMRSAAVGAVLALVTVVSTLTFGSSLHTLVSRPALYGWNWNYVLNASQAVPPQTLKALGTDPDVLAWGDATEAEMQLDGHNVPAQIMTLPTAVTPPILTGHALQAGNQIVLGAATLAELHKRVGDVVTLTYGSPQNAPIYVPPTRLIIAGTAALPAIGYSSFIADHTSMGVGALVSDAIEPAAFIKATTNPDPLLNGPQFAMVQLRPGVSAKAGLADLQRLSNAADAAFAADPNAVGNTVTPLGVQRPAEIVNYRSTGNTPLLLAAGLAGGATLALGLTIASSVRRRRRDLAVLKALGFTPRQLVSVVVWQAMVPALVGVAIGVPVGIAAGRLLWNAFARTIFVVPEPSVPLLGVVIAAVASLALAALVAVVPGLVASRIPIAEALRAE